MPSADMPRVRSFRDLVVWRRAIDLVLETYRLTDRFPRHEIYGTVAQMRRAATSIPANIAEGHARGTTKDYLRFLRIATGSLHELETYFEVTRLLRYATEAEVAAILQLSSRTGALLARLCFRLHGKLRP